MSLTLLEIYNKVSGQAWSMFDGDVQGEGGFETSLLSSIQKALSELWLKYPYSFRNKELNFTTITGTKNYDSPNGNIIEKEINDEIKFCVSVDGTYINYIDDYTVLDNASGPPTGFYLKNDKVWLYPTPDAEYNVNVEYLTLEVGHNENNEPIFSVEKGTDVIDIPDKYNKLFENALITLSMVYGIAQESNPTFSSYVDQAERAFQTLVKYVQGIEKSSRIGW